MSKVYKLLIVILIICKAKQYKTKESEEFNFLQNQMKWSNIYADDRQLFSEFDPKYSVSFLLKPLTEFCIYQHSETNFEYMRGAYYVSSGKIDVIFTAKTYMDEVISSNVGTELIFQYFSGYIDSTISFCFNNFYIENVVVMFAISGYNDKSDEINSVVDPINSSIDTIGKSLNTILSSQNFIFNNLNRYTYDFRKTNKKMNRLVIIVALTVIIISSIQIYYIKRLVEKVQYGLLG